MTLAGDYKVSALQNLLASFLGHFSNDQDEVWCGVEPFEVEQFDAALELGYWNQGK